MCSIRTKRGCYDISTPHDKKNKEERHLTSEQLDVQAIISYKNYAFPLPIEDVSYEPVPTFIDMILKRGTEFLVSESPMEFR